MSRSEGHEGLSLGYRIMYRVRFIGLHLFGPAQLGAEDDPVERLKRERQAKIAAARRTRLDREAGSRGSPG